MCVKQGATLALFLLAVTPVAKLEEDNTSFDPWDGNYAVDDFSHEMPWGDWELTTTIFDTSNSTVGTSSASAPRAVPCGLDMKVMQELTSDLGQNQACSPYLLGQMMSQVWLAAEGTTRNEITPALGLASPSPDDFLPSYKAAIEYLTAPSDKITTAAFNRVYIHKTFPISPSYSGLLSDYYLTRERSFSSPSHASEEVNNDVANMTNSHIQTLISEDDLKNVSLVLLSALYFKAPWKYTFTTTTTEPFLTTTGEKQVKMMTLSGVTLPHLQMSTFDAIALPYSDSDYCMLLLRPRHHNMEAVAALKIALSTLNITDIVVRLEAAPLQDTLVRMPRFSMEKEYNLKQTMRALGIREIFLPNADFSGVTKKRDLFVGQIKHKVCIDVTEAGTGGATVDGAMHVSNSSLPRVSFDVNMPFFAIIYNKMHQVNLCTMFVASPS